MTLTSFTQKQLTILLLLYRFRFLSRIHIQSLLNHKNHKRIQAWLNSLVESEYIGRIYTRVVGANNVPAVYFLKTKARRMLKGQKGVQEPLLKKIYKESTRSQSFIDHCLFLADVYLHLQSTAKENQEALHFYTKTDLGAFGYLPLPFPDAYIALEASKKNIKRYFLDVIDEGVPRFAIRKKIERYFTYYDTNLWQKYHKHAFPKVLIICPTESLKKYLHKFITNKMEEETAEVDFYVTGKEKLEWERVEADDE